MAKLCEACDAGGRQCWNASEVKIQDGGTLNGAPPHAAEAPPTESVVLR